jgi:histone H3/H4
MKTEQAITLAPAPKQQPATDHSDKRLESFLRNIMQNDIQELFQELADDTEICQRIQVNILIDITEVGRLVRLALVRRFERMAVKDMRAESEA